MQHHQIRPRHVREQIAAHNRLTELHLKGRERHALKILREIVVSNRLPFASPGEVYADD